METGSHNDFLYNTPYVEGDIAIVAASWHEGIVSSLIEGALSVIHKIKPDEAPILFRVAGSYEIPQVVSELARSEDYVAIVPLACIIKGETPHFELIASTVFQALDEIARATGVAISNGILTTENLVQAQERSGGSLGNKGAEAAQAAISLAYTLKEIRTDQDNE